MSAKATIYSLTVASAPASGPVIVTILGLDIPVLSLSISMVGLLLARIVSLDDPNRKLTKLQDFAMTGILCIILFLIVTGQFFGEPMSVGMAFSWAVGLGFSGIMILDIIANRIREMIDVWLNRKQ